MPRLLTILALGLLAGCAAPSPACFTQIDVVHVIDEPGAGDRVLLQVHGVAEHGSALLEFTLPADWPARATSSRSFEELRRGPPFTPELRVRTDLEIEPGRAFSLDALPDGVPRDGVLLLHADAYELRQSLARELAGERSLLRRDDAAALREALDSGAPAYGSFTSSEGSVTTLYLFGLTHEPPLWKELAAFEFVRLDPEDPAWAELGCVQPTSSELAADSAARMLMWLGFWVVVFTA